MPRRGLMRTANLSNTDWVDDADRRALAAEVRRTRQPNQLVHLSIGEIAPTPAERNSRASYDDASLDEMAASIREHGVLQPILVRPLPRHEAEDWAIVINGEETHPSYVVIAGNRRLLGARRAGLLEVPSVIRVTDAERAFVLNVVENVQRRDLSGAERIRSITILASLHGADGRPLPTTEVARLTGLNQSTVWRWLRINHKPELREALANDRLDIGRAMKLVRVPDEHLCEVLEQAPTLSQFELEERVAEYRNDPAVIAKRAASLTERRLMDALRALGKVDQVPREGATRDLLGLVRDRVEELWDLPSDVSDADARAPKSRPDHAHKRDRDRH